MPHSDSCTQTCRGGCVLPFLLSVHPSRRRFWLWLKFGALNKCSLGNLKLFSAQTLKPRKQPTTKPALSPEEGVSIMHFCKPWMCYICMFYISGSQLVQPQDPDFSLVISWRSTRFNTLSITHVFDHVVQLIVLFMFYIFQHPLFNTVLNFYFQAPYLTI